MVLFDHGNYSRRYVKSYEALRSGVASGGLAQTASRLLGGSKLTGVQDNSAVETKVVATTNVGIVTDAVVTAAPAPQVPQVEPPAPMALAIASLSKLATSPEVGDARSASEFQILNVTVGMTEAQALAVIAGEFSPDQIATDPGRGAIFAERGACNYADPADPAVVAEAGSFCLALQLTDGAVTRIALRQVIPGDVTAPAISAFQDRYGEPDYQEIGVAGTETRQLLVGWGRPAGAERDALGRVPSALPATVLEGNLWHGYGVSTIVLRLDKEAPPPAPAAEIKF